jgi:4,5:9,10-diseco-3-hydroxy-5,9,17-trioxoandrosta-1(10),2-diene-4-oate hydrolase
MGGGGTPVILLHGLGGYIENWDLNMAALAQERQVYAVDLVGFGLSDKPQVEYTIPYLTTFVHKFMQALDIERATLVGESMGGIISLWFAQQYPEQVEKLVLEGSGGLGKEVSIFLRIMTLPVLGEYLARPSRKGSEDLQKLVFYNQGLIMDEWIEEDYQMSNQPGAQRCFLSALRSIGNIWGVKREVDTPILEGLEKIEVPTLIIWGEQDQIIPVAHAHAAAEGLPNARLHIFDGCGHVPNIERAEEFNQLVTAFLSSEKSWD